jgi:hypothetical protein
MKRGHMNLQTRSFQSAGVGEEFEKAKEVAFFY